MRRVVPLEQRMVVSCPTWLRLTWESITTPITTCMGGKIGHWPEGSFGFLKQWSQNPFCKGRETTPEDFLIYGLEPVEDVVIPWVPIQRGTKNKICSSASSDIADQRWSESGCVSLLSNTWAQAKGLAVQCWYLRFFNLPCVHVF